MILSCSWCSGIQWTSYNLLFYKFVYYLNQAWQSGLIQVLSTFWWAVMAQSVSGHSNGISSEPGLMAVRLNLWAVMHGLAGFVRVWSVSLSERVFHSNRIWFRFVGHAVGLPACERVLCQFLSTFPLQLDGWLTQLVESCGDSAFQLVSMCGLIPTGQLYQPRLCRLDLWVVISD